MPNHILTANGDYFDFNDIWGNKLDIEVIAHSLSNLCRFTGHTREFYSVAQHSVLVSLITPTEDAFAGLMHDAPEAFIGDVATPIKRMLPDYRKIEKQVEEFVLGMFGIHGLSQAVKLADLRMLATERRDLMLDQDTHWRALDGVEPVEDKIVPISPGEAFTYFMERYEELQALQHKPKPALVG